MVAGTGLLAVQGGSTGWIQAETTGFLDRGEGKQAIEGSLLAFQNA